MVCSSRRDEHEVRCRAGPRRCSFLRVLLRSQSAHGQVLHLGAVEDAGAVGLRPSAGVGEKAGLVVGVALPSFGSFKFKFKSGEQGGGKTEQEKEEEFEELQHHHL